MTKEKWVELKEEYLKGGITYRELAAKYGLTQSAVEGMAWRQKWRKKFEEIVRKSEEKTIDILSSEAAAHKVRVLRSSKMWLAELDKLKKEVCKNSRKSMDIAAVALSIQRLDDISRRSLGIQELPQVMEVTSAPGGLELQAQILQELYAIKALAAQGKTINLSDEEIDQIAELKVIEDP